MPSDPARPRRAAARLLIVLALLALGVHGAPAALLPVDSLNDTPDALPGDGICADGSGDCTLRAALQEANAHPGPDRIVFLPVVHGLTVFPASPYVTLGSAAGDATILDGVGANMTVDGGGSVPTMLVISARDCIVRGLTVQGFGIGLQILNGVADTLGGTIPASRNTITGNGTGIRIHGGLAELNAVIDNLVTLNSGDGIVLTNGASRNTLQANECTWNGGHGILLDGALMPGVIPGPVEQNALLENFVGMSRSPEAAAPNGQDGIRLTTLAAVTDDVRFNHIDDGVVSANTGSGISMRGGRTFENRTEGNRIGLDSGGALLFGNGGSGVEILQGAHGNQVGPPLPGNLDVIGDNGADGVRIDGAGTDVNLVRNGHIGMDVTGYVACGNGSDGVQVSGGARNNTVQRCLISDNHDNGVLIRDGNTDQNRVRDSFIGTDVDGLAGFGNGQSDPDEGGVLVDAGPTLNTIGPANLVGDHPDSAQFGICIRGKNTQVNYVLGNVVGLDIVQAAELPNYVGVYIDQASNNEVGPDNVVSGNDSYGILVEGNGNDVFRNVVGLDGPENVAWPNLSGVAVNGQFNRIGRGTGPGDGNVICANDEWGIVANTGNTTPLVGNEAHGNLIGVTHGGAAQGNARGGIQIRCGVELDVLGDVEANEIAYNAGGFGGVGGVVVGSLACGLVPDAVGNEITSNSIHSNTNLGIDLIGPGNHGIPAPSVVPSSVTTTSATVLTNLAVTSSVELFYDDAEEGRVLVAQDPAAVGSASFSFAPVPLGVFLTATNTADFTGTLVPETSQFSDSVQVLAGTGVDVAVPLPAETRLVGAEPNPFRAAVTVAFDLAVPSSASLRVYDVSGRLVRVLTDGELPAGRYRVSWGGSGRRERAAPGVYFCRLETPGRTFVRKLTLLR